MTNGMRPWITTLICCCSILVLLGCGDDDSGTNDNVNQNGNSNQNANQNTNQNQNQNNIDITPYTGGLDDLNGYYEMTSVTLRPISTDVEITREPTDVFLYGLGTTQGFVRGHGDVDATSATEGTLDLRWVAIGDYEDRGDLPILWYNNTELWTAVWDPAEGRVVLQAGDDTVVYFLAFEGDVLTLLLDEDDSRNTVTDAPIQFVMTAMARPQPEISGTWDIQQQLVFGTTDYTLTAACSPLDPGDHMQGSYGTSIGTLVIEDSGWITRQLSDTTYDSSDCTGTPADTWSMEHLFYFDIGNSADTLVWYYDGVGSDDFHLRSEVSYTLDGTTLTLTVDEWDSNLDKNNYSIVGESVCTAAP